MYESVDYEVWLQPAPAPTGRPCGMQRAQANNLDPNT